MKRGEVWTAAGAPDYAGKPRPVVVVQNDRFDSNDSITVALCTSDPTDLPLFRVLIEPSTNNGLQGATRVMADKITTLSRSKMGRRIGRLGDPDVVRVDQAILLFFGLTGTV